MRIAVTGARGRLGSELVRRGCIPVEADVTDAGALHRALAGAKPDVVVHCAAITDVDGCEHSPNQAAQVNTFGVYLLRQIFNGKIVYISTDYIFDGKNGPYREEDTPSPISIYGWSKLGGELVLRDYSPAKSDSDSLIVRTTVLFDRDSRNFVTAVIGRLLNGETVTAPDTLYGSPTYIPHLADGVLMAIDLGLSGVINIAGSRVVSRLVLARLIAKRIGQGVTRVFDGPVTGAAPRPLNAGLITEKAQKLGIPIYDPFAGIDEIIKERTKINALENLATR